MQPDRGESPCTPKDPDPHLPERAGEPGGGPARFFDRRILPLPREPIAPVRVSFANKQKGCPMLKLKTGLAAGVLSAALALTSVVPAQAVTFMRVPVPSASAVEQVQYRDHRGWYHGHRGYRHARPGYRRHSDGWWYPFAAFGLGAAIGGAISNDRHYGNRHVNWCANRYRSYRTSDNTFQPNHGPRKQCISPYAR